jgi:hypothetical protein
MNEEEGWRLIEGDNPFVSESLAVSSGARLAVRLDSAHRNAVRSELFKEIFYLEHKQEQYDLLTNIHETPLYRFLAKWMMYLKLYFMRRLEPSPASILLISPRTDSLHKAIDLVNAARDSEEEARRLSKEENIRTIRANPLYSHYSRNEILSTLYREIANAYAKAATMMDQAEFEYRSDDLTPFITGAAYEHFLRTQVKGTDGASHSGSSGARLAASEPELIVEIAALELEYEGVMKSFDLKNMTRLKEIRDRADALENKILEAWRGISERARQKRLSLIYATDSETIEALKEDLLTELTAYRIQHKKTQGARLAQEDLNVQAQEELQAWAESKGAESTLLLNAISDENFSFERVSEAEKEAIWEDILTLLPRIAPKTIEGELLAAKNPERALRKLKLHLYHPSFGDPLNELKVQSPKAPRAAVWTLDMIQNDPFFFDVLEDRDQKIAGKMTIEDFVLVPGKTNVKDLLGDRYEAFKSRFPDTRILETVGEDSPDSVYSRLGGRFERAHVLFIGRSDGARLSETSPKDQGLKQLILEGPYALTLDKVAVRILALGDKAFELSLKGLKRRGNVFIFSPLAPVDFEKHFKRFYETLKQVAQAA